MDDESISILSSIGPCRMCVCIVSFAISLPNVNDCHLPVDQIIAYYTTLTQHKKKQQL